MPTSVEILYENKFLNKKQKNKKKGLQKEKKCGIILPFGIRTKK